MQSIVKLHFLSALVATAFLCALTAAQTSATASSYSNNNNGNINPQQQQRLEPRAARYNPYDPYYNNRYFKSRDYYTRQYYDNLFKRYNPDVAASQARILDQSAKLNHDGTYAYSYETENGIQVEEHGAPVRAGTEEQKEVVEGSYSFVAPNGLRVIVKYTADENGYHPTITYDGANAERFTRLQQPADTVITRQN